MHKEYLEDFVPKGEPLRTFYERLMCRVEKQGSVPTSQQDLQTTVSSQITELEHIISAYSPESTARNRLVDLSESIGEVAQTLRSLANDAYNIDQRTSQRFKDVRELVREYSPSPGCLQHARNLSHRAMKILSTLTTRS